MDTNGAAKDLLREVATEAEKRLVMIAHFAGSGEAAEADALARAGEMVKAANDAEREPVLELCAILLAAAIVLRMLVNPDQVGGGIHAAH